MEKAKRDLQGLKAKLGSAEALGLSWEAKRILRLFSQGLTDWQRGDYKKPWRVNYREAVESYGAEFASVKGPSTKTAYWMMFLTQFRGGKDSEKASRSLAEFWLLARRVAPKAVEELLLKDENDEEGKQFIESLDEALAAVFKDGEKAEKLKQGARIARRVLPRQINIVMKRLSLHGQRMEVRR